MWKQSLDKSVRNFKMVDAQNTYKAMLAIPCCLLSLRVTGNEMVKQGNPTSNELKNNSSG